MTQSIPWPLAYSAFIIVMIAVGILTFMGLRVLENRKIRSHRQIGG
jgi:magnesium transporter